ncbi:MULTISPECIES: hypothetical protein [unclassified Amycolatopsis]|uniref:hypothetical protein n=1 Tax=unclassified Amycolatopsis TaxID=2618356 RepID=UPI002E1BDA8A|nr:MULTISPECIES: hypothetical protein [unclassified Amycolatopsis]
MIKRVLAGLLAAAAIGTLAALAAPTAAAAPGHGDPAVRPPGTDCVWIWTHGPPQCRKLE